MTDSNPAPRHGRKGGEAGKRTDGKAAYCRMFSEQLRRAKKKKTKTCYIQKSH